MAQVYKERMQYQKMLQDATAELRFQQRYFVLKNNGDQARMSAMVMLSKAIEDKKENQMEKNEEFLQEKKKKQEKALAGQGAEV